MAEWPNAVVLKTIEPKGSGGSNPSLSAIRRSRTNYPAKPELGMRASPKDGFDERSEMGHPKGDREAIPRSGTNPSLSAIRRASLAHGRPKYKYLSMVWNYLTV